ncbi:hypothetical protein FOZ60_006439 [Perkinsus olseni]|uniref:Uncharacterized protein n=1 Tax=Perkinsus olseni TaxID=32597 RepID=A0A7J6PFN9_PEROL|nr:hypothetical protein FOZ60_006439 [Perkinsus olseni]
MSLTSSSSSPLHASASPSSASTFSRASDDDQPSLGSESELEAGQSRILVSVIRKNRRKKSDLDTATFVLDSGDKLVIEVDRAPEGEAERNSSDKKKKKSKRPRASTGSVKEEKSSKRSSTTRTTQKSKTRWEKIANSLIRLSDGTSMICQELVEARLVIHREDPNLPAIRKNDFKIWTGQPLQTQIIDVLKRGLYRDISSWHCEFDKEGGRMLHASLAPASDVRILSTRQAGRRVPGTPEHPRIRAWHHHSCQAWSEALRVAALRRVHYVQ